ncbi:MAG: hypothetical protein ACREU6_07035, partial [Steroidobacteraceae bacterium]
GALLTRLDDFEPSHGIPGILVNRRLQERLAGKVRELVLATKPYFAMGASELASIDSPRRANALGVAHDRVGRVHPMEDLSAFRFAECGQKTVENFLDARSAHETAIPNALMP